MSVLEKFSQITASVMNSEISSWQNEGGKIIGYICPFIPEEIIIAGGFLPFKIRGVGSNGTSAADEYFDTKNCSYVRHCFDQALIGKFDFLDAMVVGTGCDHTRRIFDNWQHAPLKTKLVYLLDHPRTIGSDNVQDTIIEYYRAQLVKLKEFLENNFGVEITVPNLNKAIKLCNESRALQKKIFELRKTDNAPLTAMEIATIMLAGVSIPKEQYIKDLKILLNELSNTTPVKKDYKVRLMILGPVIEDPSFFNIFEELGANIVIDDTCSGARYAMKSQIDENSTNPLRSIAKSNVVDLPYCPKINGSHVSRSKFVEEMIKEFKVDGIIAQGYVSCDSWGSSFGMLNAHFKSKGIPYLRLDREYLSTEVGQIKTRIQAFIETIGG